MTTPPKKRHETFSYVAWSILIILAAILLYMQVQDSKEGEATAEKQGAEATERAETAEGYVAAIDADCKGRSGVELAEHLKKAGRCGQAEKIAEQEPLPPLQGDAGEDGRGILASSIVGSDLILTYTDGTVVNAGRVQGLAGKPGGDGSDGTDGRGITGASITETGDLVLAFTDGGSANLGRVRGLNGTDGQPGKDGVDGVTPDLSGYATEDWVRALINALGCTVTTVGEQGPPLVFECAVTGKP